MIRRLLFLIATTAFFASARVANVYRLVTANGTGLNAKRASSLRSVSPPHASFRLIDSLIRVGGNSGRRLAVPSTPRYRDYANDTLVGTLHA